MEFPKNFQEWKHCIEVTCGIPLTKTFIQQRLHELSDTTNQHTKDFISLYGTAYNQQVIEWFKLAYQQLIK